jgi:predicted enzyme related to lactoylglutathione lyase
MAIIEKHTPGSFCWVELATCDQAAARDFYTKLFGWTFNEFPMGPGDLYTIFRLRDRDVAAAYTMRKEQRDQGVPPNWMIYILVDDVDDAAARAGQLDGKVCAPPFDVMDVGRMSVIQDSTGGMFAAWQTKGHAGTGIGSEPGALCWADLSTPDPASAQKFYSGMFGWKISAGEKDSSGYLHIQNGEDYIGGIPPAQHRNPHAPPHWLLYFQVADVDATAAQAKGLGANLHLPPMSMENVGRMSVMADPQGAAFAIFKPEREAK